MNTESASVQPYMIRAVYEWCTDQGLTPHLAAMVDDQVQVPRQYVQDEQIVLNIGMHAVSELELGNEWIRFHARFGGVAQEIFIPVHHVLAIYAGENGQGMTFAPVLGEQQEAQELLADQDEDALASDNDATSEKPKIELVSSSEPEAHTADDEPSDDKPPTPPAGKKKPGLKRIK